MTVLVMLLAGRKKSVLLLKARFVSSLQPAHMTWFQFGYLTQSLLVTESPVYQPLLSLCTIFFLQEPILFFLYPTCPMREAFARQSAVDLCDSTDSSRRNSEEIFDGPYYSTIDDFSTDGDYISPEETSTTTIQLNQEVHIDQSRLLTSTSASTSSAQEIDTHEDEEATKSATSQANDQIEIKTTPHQQQKEEQEEEEEAKETSVSLLLSSSSMCDGILWMREDLLVGCDNMSNVNICRLDDLREAIARLRKETQVLEQTDMILKTKIAYIVDRRVRVRQDLLEDMTSWEFV
jgi:hypothetical protein